MVQLTDELVALLDAEAARTGVSRSAVIRHAVERYLDDAADAALTRAIVEGYRRLPPAAPDEWGSLDVPGDRAALELAQRLDAEERDAGLPPW